MELKVIYEDNHLIGINKPPGLLVQGDRTGDITVIDQVSEYLRHKYHKPGKVFVGLIHRLDRPVSGVLLIARTSKALTRMNLAFQQREVQKTYWAVINGTLPMDRGRLEDWLIKDHRKNKAKVYKPHSPGAKKAVLDYHLLRTHGKRRLVVVEPSTGRPHQIRVQLSAVGCPIMGDRKYGYMGKSTGAIALHARQLDFIHPVRRDRINLTADPPELPYWQNITP